MNGMDIDAERKCHAPSGGSERREAAFTGD